jgi:hypothetical protein
MARQPASAERDLCQRRAVQQFRLRGDRGGAHDATVQMPRLGFTLSSRIVRAKNMQFFTLLT